MSKRALRGLGHAVDYVAAVLPRVCLHRITLAPTLEIQVGEPEGGQGQTKAPETPLPDASTAPRGLPATLGTVSSAAC